MVVVHPPVAIASLSERAALQLDPNLGVPLFLPFLVNCMTISHTDFCFGRYRCRWKQHLLEIYSSVCVCVCATDPLLLSRFRPPAVVGKNGKHIAE